jgi:hypothetical protein
VRKYALLSCSALPAQPLRSGTKVRLPGELTVAVKPATPVVASTGNCHTGVGGGPGVGELVGVSEGVDVALGVRDAVRDCVAVTVAVVDVVADAVGVAEGHAPGSAARPTPAHSAGHVHAKAAGVLALVMSPPGQNEPAGQSRQRPDAASL